MAVGHRFSIRHCIDFQSVAMAVLPGLFHSECPLYLFRKKGKSAGTVVGPPSLMQHTCRLTFDGS